MHENEISEIIIGRALKVHSKLGPGLLESAYEAPLAYELSKAGLRFERQKPQPLIYEQVKLDVGYRLDLLVEGKVIVELKSVERVTPAHKKQLLTYLRLTALKLGYLLNFGEALMREGITRTINGTLDSEPPCLGASVREKIIEPAAGGNAE